MIGIDTNVLVRYLVQDNRKQAAAATALIEGRCSTSSPGYLSTVVLCELVWVLRGSYQYKKELVERVLEQILVTTEFEIENEDIVRKAVNDFKMGTADFSDYLIVNGNKQSGCIATYSFDKKLSKHGEVTVPPA